MGVKKRRGLCKYKTEKGNVYPDWMTAKNAAIGYGKKIKAKEQCKRGLNAYYCEFCGKYHIGKDRSIRRSTMFYIDFKKYSIIQYLEKWISETAVPTQNNLFTEPQVQCTPNSYVNRSNPIACDT